MINGPLQSELVELSRLHTRSTRFDVPLSNVCTRHVREQHIITQACAAESLRTFPSWFFSSLAHHMKLRRLGGYARSGKAETRRVNVNVLTRLPKIRAVPAPISPLNSTPVYPPRQAQSLVHLWTVGCWGFDVGEGSNGIKDPILFPFSVL